MKFKIALDNSTTETVEGSPINIAGMDCFIHYDGAITKVSDKKSGMLIYESHSSEIVNSVNASFLIGQHGLFQIERSNRKKLQHAGLNYPIN